MAGFLLDTNHLSVALAKVSPLRDHLRQALKQGHKVGTTWTVLCELEAGIVFTQHPDRNRQSLRFLLDDIKVWPSTMSLVRSFGEAVCLTRKKGVSLSFVDTELVAHALCRDLTILTKDRDFSHLPEIKCANWVDLPPLQ